MKLLNGSMIIFKIISCFPLSSKLSWTNQVLLIVGRDSSRVLWGCRSWIMKMMHYVKRFTNTFPANDILVLLILLAENLYYYWGLGILRQLLFVIVIVVNVLQLSPFFIYTVGIQCFSYFAQIVNLFSVPIR